ncbi:MAG: peptidoglycan DD-metalloendopeptidase family protein [Desulfocapsaceae bacterium]|nr:peptidoglycan DD-metalloendopeptidase family protein [Desulfocapsaceae bacterium]
MSEHFHIIIAGDQHRPFSCKISKKNAIITVASVLFIASVLFSTGFFTSALYTHNRIMAKGMSSAKEKVKETLAANIDLRKRIDQQDEESEKHIAHLERKHAEELNNLIAKYTTQVTKLKEVNEQQRIAFQEEKERLLSTTVSQLETRSKFIEDVITDIGIDIEPPVIKQSSKIKGTQKGGPFIAAEDSKYDELLYRADNYLQTLKTTPLGRPVNTSVSSWFGKRRDPLNRRNAFHEGIDFRGRTGDPVRATADGKVIYAGKNGGYGNFIKISHGNGYTTSYAHMHRLFVSWGDRVTRGQKIGSVGNSGRSTGSHLHYEVNLNGRPINPAKLMKVANLTCKFNTDLETE